MDINEIKKMNELTAAFGSRYAAVIFLSKKARYLKKIAGYYISESQAIKWAITDVKPKQVVLPKKYKMAENLPISCAMELVDDNGVKSCVFASLRQSVYKLLNRNITFDSDDQVPEQADYTEKFMSRFILDHDKLNQKDLVFIYDDLDDCRQARVRILCRMIWGKYNLDIGG